jgi:hypothetical protein
MMTVGEDAGGELLEFGVLGEEHQFLLGRQPYAYVSVG